ncbi:DUF309 domain-containing protein [Leptolyngbya ohadii]|uniref:DUF309 domain-containing protein n=1 Tax=Leptolyngbya ohadii TaxID=1962290 RepID=UPI000B59FD28|nr:DUF309 domain-containing protein [Leptolyngbya ohadii]
MSDIAGETIPPEFWQGVQEFNQGQFYDCHDTLEAIWMQSGEPEKTFYQGVLQIAVALYHLSNQNSRGAMILLGEGMNRLRRYEPVYSGINVSSLIEESEDLLATLYDASIDRIAEMATQVRSLAEGGGGCDFPVPRIEGSGE